MPDINTPQSPGGSPDNSRDNEAIQPTHGLPNAESQQPFPQQDIDTSQGSVSTGLPPNIHNSEQPKSSKSRLMKLLKWLALLLIAGPILLLIVLGMAFSGPDGGLVVVALGTFLVIPMALGLLLCIVLACLFLFRKPKDVKTHPVKKALAAVFVILTLALLSTATYAYINYHNQQNKYKQFFTLNQQQAVQLIDSCKISDLSQDTGGQEEFDFNNNDVAAASAQNASGIGFYTAYTSNWAALVNAANQASKKCGFIEADNLNPKYTWVSLNDAQQLLLSCKIREVDKYYDGVYQYGGTTVNPSGSRTGIAVLNKGNYEALYVTDNILPLLKSDVNNSQEKCGIQDLNEIYTE